MCLHFRLLIACLITNVTSIGTLASMYKLMCLHGRLVIECLITNVS